MLKERKKKERLQYTFFNLISKHATKSHLKNNFKAVAISLLCFICVIKPHAMEFLDLIFIPR